MKKITALFLALALCLSLCTVTAFAGTISTIGAVLNNFAPGFPTSNYTDYLPEGAWIKEGSSAKCCRCSNFLEFLIDTTIIILIDCSSPVTSNGDNCYEYKNVDGNKVDFYIENNKLTSIVASGTDFTNKGLDGTYTDPVVTHTVTVDNTNIQHGMVTASPTDVASGTDVTLTVTPDNGYQLKADSLKVTASGTDIPVTGSGNSYSFVMPNENVTVTAQFEYAGGGHHHGGGSTTPTVTAPKTADMGVALYGVLSVSSLLGMGWVSKKEKQ